ncbi:DNA-binding MurR/RpiR family transcriptional regulator [Kitasatospora sp. SolWspMP-SS2h]|uniref:MurR/RpiR family transcriptional regulator n=1 Tax=Kitasatospora sp. SolWspMP-SS2h TaxID=1305729 RepID=UPI000DB9B873|nr:MurR/RpiR family transcriptional regulator [Kitasatospora sp. SolWspMP-SS2h]RAJ36834.1 DNA-binding MurR/RpiR family transcriptional regulator [Kitasatospora sp. SolWspMP-SS2h]
MTAAGYASAWSEPAATLADAADQLGGTEERLARVMLADWPDSALRPPTALLAEAGAGCGDLHRLVRAAGFRDLGELQARVTERLDGELTAPQERFRARLRPAQLPGLTRRMAEREAANVAATLDGAADDGTLDAAARSLLAARQRFVLGTGRSRGLAHLLAADLGSVLGRVVLLDGGTDRAVEALTDAGPRDVAVVYSVRRYDRWTLRAAQALRGRGVPLVAVVDGHGSPVAPLADRTLTAATGGPSFADSPTALVALGHALVTAAAARSKGALRRLERREEADRLLGRLPDD